MGINARSTSPCPLTKLEVAVYLGDGDNDSLAIKGRAAEINCQIVIFHQSKESEEYRGVHTWH